MSSWSPKNPPRIDIQEEADGRLVCLRCGSDDDPRDRVRMTTVREGHVGFKCADCGERYAKDGKWRYQLPSGRWRKSKYGIMSGGAA